MEVEDAMEVLRRRFPFEKYGEDQVGRTIFRLEEEETSTFVWLAARVSGCMCSARHISPSPRGELGRFMECSFKSSKCKYCRWNTKWIMSNWFKAESLENLESKLDTWQTSLNDTLSVERRNNGHRYGFFFGY